MKVMVPISVGLFFGGMIYLWNIHIVIACVVGVCMIIATRKWLKIIHELFIVNK